MKKRYMRGLIVIMLLGAMSESYSGYYERYVPSWIRYYDVLWGSGLVGGGLGYGLGQATGYNPYKLASAGALSGMLLLPLLVAHFRNQKAQLKVESQKKLIEGDIDKMTQRIRENWVINFPSERQIVQGDILDVGLITKGSYGLNVIVTKSMIEKYVSDFLNKKISQDQVIAFNGAIVDLLKLSSVGRDQRRLLKELFDIYADPNKENENKRIKTFYSFDELSNETLTDDVINAVIDYLNDNNRFTSENLFPGYSHIKG